MKKIFCAVLVFALSLVFCGAALAESKIKSSNEGEWPDNEWTEKLSEPSAGAVGRVSILGSKKQTLSIKMDWTRGEAAAYCDEITVAGAFDQNVFAYYKDSTPISVLLEAENADGWKVGVSETEIRIIKP